MYIYIYNKTHKINIFLKSLIDTIISFYKLKFYFKYTKLLNVIILIVQDCLSLFIFVCLKTVFILKSLFSIYSKYIHNTVSTWCIHFASHCSQSITKTND